MKNPIALVFDTETIDLKDRRCFDIGWTVGDLVTGEIIQTESYLVKDIFNTELYQKAYYYEQNDSFYQNALETQLIEIKDIIDIRLAMNKAIHEIGVSIIAAFNIEFDIGALAVTYNHFKALDIDRTKEEKEKLYRAMSTTSLANRFTVIDIPILFAYAVEPKYGKWCRDKGYTTAKGFIQTKVDTINRYLISPDYAESHTAGKDSMDEFHILHKYWGKTDKWQKEKSKAWKILKDRGF